MDITTMNRGQITLLGSAICVMLTMHFTIQLLSQHLFYWKNPKEQKAIIIIILMAPIYAIVSFVGLVDFRGSKPFFLYLDSIKECYEAFVIAKFLLLMYSYLKISISKNIVPDEIKGREIHHSFPMTLFQPHTVHLNHHTLKLLKYWTWQFVVIRPVCSALMITLQVLDIYPSWVSWTFTIILNVSVSLALYSLVVFYHVFAKELAPHKPLPKFLCIKGIVFFCFWQYDPVTMKVPVWRESPSSLSFKKEDTNELGTSNACVFLRLNAYGIVPVNLVSCASSDAELKTLQEHIEEAIQNVLVCLEMVVFSVLQQYAYHVAPYSGDVVVGIAARRHPSSSADLAARPSSLVGITAPPPPLPPPAAASASASASASTSTSARFCWPLQLSSSPPSPPPPSSPNFEPNSSPYIRAL
ncbi:hypothetical protein TEA_025457 [Camellia sinensis var. sinensis]|uniref:Uncharacterized protein n=1 Tax=Camellia sinensis var. sinensis TaxID=542762 RepID=A0A4S4DDH7_CAMSN|nr:hypothetical protein TEA_025457 [Camellia sinensis var. sinensis]